MVKTSEKLILGILIVVFIAMTTALITAISDSSAGEQKASVKVIYSDDIGENDNEDADEDDETEVAVTGSALEKASAAALEYIGEGRVTDSEVEDEEGYYEIEVTLDNGREVDVHLDESFKVLSVEYE